MIHAVKEEIKPGAFTMVFKPFNKKMLISYFDKLNEVLFNIDLVRNKEQFNKKDIAGAQNDSVTDDSPPNSARGS